HYDCIILATGAFVNRLLPNNRLPVTEVKGQVLDLSWPHHLDPLPLALNSHIYLLMNHKTNSCTIGATYERNFNSILPDLNAATKELLPKAKELLPALKESRVLSCRAGVRASAPDYLPIIKKIDPRIWVITGMGSKGLLYHALYAEKLVNMIIDKRS